MKLLFIGGINAGKPPLGGDQYKNQLILEYFRDKHINSTVIDTFQWNYRPFTLLKLFFLLAIGGYDRIILSVSSGSAYRLIRLLNLFPRKLKNTVYLVIGGFLPTGIKNRKYSIKFYQGLKIIAVEGKMLKEGLLELGLENVVVVPNFKKITRLPERASTPVSAVKFVFISRITQAKGVTDIVEATRLLNNNGYTDRFTVTFYGPVDQAFKTAFDSYLNRQLIYEGILNIIEEPDQCYEKLSCYDCMLFPTYWSSEGFPGVIIDAFIAGLPVIASDWNMNTELIQDGVNGIIIHPRNPHSLAEAMKKVIDNPELLRDMSVNAKLRAEDYDIEKIGPEIIRLIES